MKKTVCLLILCIQFVTTYSQIKAIEVSHYIFPEFTKGIILMKAGMKSETLLNYNTVTEEMVFDKNGKKLAIGNDEIELIDTIYIKDKKFVVVNKKFMEVALLSKFNLYAEHRCEVTAPVKQAAYGGEATTSATVSVSSLSTNGQIYELQLPDGYKAKPYIIYWLFKDGQMSKFNSIKQLNKMFPEKKDILKAYQKSNEVDYKNRESIINLIKYIESN